MKLIKMFGLAAIAAVAAMAFVGASSATANQSTTLCKVANQLPCLAANQYPVKTVIEGKATDPVLLGEFGGVLCASGVTKGEIVTASLAKPLLAKLTSVTFSSCLETVFHTPCNTQTVTLGHLLILKVKYNEATVEPHNTEVLVRCDFIGIHCRYTGLPTLTALGTTATTVATIHANEAVLTPLNNQPGENCFEGIARWDALYDIVTPKPIHISS